MHSEQNIKEIVVRAIVQIVVFGRIPYVSLIFPNKRRKEMAQMHVVKFYL